MKKFRIFGWQVCISREPVKIVRRRPSRKRSEVRLQRLKMAGYRCEICGREIDIRCSLHHRLPVGAENRNAIENVMALCTRCHHEMEARPHVHALRHLEDNTRYEG